MKVKRDGRTWKEVREQDGYRVAPSSFPFKTLVLSELSYRADMHTYILTGRPTDKEFWSGRFAP